MSNSPDKNSWLSHPMVNVIVGFLLTGVVGTIITQHFFDRRQQEQLRALQLQHRKEIIQVLAQRIAEFEMRAELLIGDLEEAESKEEIMKTKQAYDDAFIKWRTDNPAAILLAKDLLNSSEYQNFRMNVEVKLHNGMLEPVRQCMQQAYASAAHSEQAVKFLQECDVRGQLQKLNQCTSAVAEQLHELTGVSAGISKKIEAQRRAELDQQVKQNCS